MSMRIDLENSWNRVPLSQASNFGRMLFDLIAKADPINRQRLNMGFPKQVAAWELYYIHGELPAMSMPSGE